MKFYKKRSPKLPLTIANGRFRLTFDTIDGEWGYYANDQAFIHNEIGKMILAGMGGVTEISESEFHAEYVQKKTSGKRFVPPYREELGAAKMVSPFAATNGVRPGIERPVATSPAPSVPEGGAKPCVVNMTDDAPVATLPVAAPVSPPANAPESLPFKPTVGRRGRNA